MDSRKKSFNTRAFVAMMAGLTGFGLPISGLALHAHSEHRLAFDGHEWTALHVFLGILFTVFVTWHIVLNRRPILNHIKAGAAGWMPLSREARWAAIITAAIVVTMISHSL